MMSALQTVGIYRYKQKLVVEGCMREREYPTFGIAHFAKVLIGCNIVSQIDSKSKTAQLTDMRRDRDKRSQEDCL